MLNDGSVDNLHAAVASQAGYALQALVAEGGQKYCYRARTPTGAVVAFKIIKSGGLIERTQREIQAMEQCRHPNIARRLGGGSETVDGMTVEYVVEPYFGKGSLAKAISANLVTRTAVVAIGVSLLSAIAYLRENALVHRDIKPENIMFSDADEPILTDFGIVRALAQTSLTATLQAYGLGTPGFMPAEQWHNQKAMIDWRADQFALGVTLAVAAFQRHPYGIGLQAVTAIAARQSPDPAFMRAATDAGLPVLIKMVQPYPVQRYSDPQRLLCDWAAQDNSESRVL